MENKIVYAEQAVETAKEKLNSIMYPTKLLTDIYSRPEQYIQAIADAEKIVDAAQEELDNLIASETHYKGILVKFDSED